MKAVVLAGGEGTRLAPYTRVLPKPLLPVGDRPILEIIVGQLREAEIGEIVLATGYLHGLIEAYFGDGSAFGVDISYAREDEPLGTAGPLARIDGLDETFVLMNGDILTDLALRELIDAHCRSDAAATVATHTETVEIDYGVLRLGAADGPLAPLQAIDEKPTYMLDVSMGIYCFEPRVVDFVEPGARVDFPELIGSLLDGGLAVNSYRHGGSWVDIGRVAHLEGIVQDLEGTVREVVERTGSEGARSGR